MLIPAGSLDARLGAPPGQAIATGLGLSATLGLLMLVPLLIGAYVDADHLSLARASLLITIEIAAGIAALIVTLCWGTHWMPRRLGPGGALLAAAGYFASTPELSFESLVGCRLVSGVGVGLLGAAVNASVACAAAPDRLYATAVLFYGAMASVLLYAIPVLCANLGHWPLFATLGALFLVTAAATLNLSDVQRGSAVRVATDIQLRYQPRDGRVVCLVAGYLLLWVAFSMVWIFAERKAASIHMGAAETGLALSVCNVVGLSGSLAVTWLGDRFGRAVPILAGGFVLAASFYALGVTLQPLVYWSAILVYGVAYFFLLPYVLGAAAELDPSGRVAILTSMVPWVSHLVSPLLGALILLRFGAFPAMAAVTAAAAGIATVILAGATRNQRQINFGE